MKSSILLIMLIVGAIVAPVTGYSAASAYVDYREASMRHAMLKRQERDLEVYSRQVHDYRRFAMRVEDFIRTARDAGVTEDGWIRHRVDVKDQEVSFPELTRLIDESAGGGNYYFRPHRLQIHAPGAGSSANPFLRAGRRNQRGTIRVSLAGDFLVPVQ